jgi:hypothetical protein
MKRFRALERLGHRPAAGAPRLLSRSRLVRPEIRRRALEQGLVLHRGRPGEVSRPVKLAQITAAPPPTASSAAASLKGITRDGILMRIRCPGIRSRWICAGPRGSRDQARDGRGVNERGGTGAFARVDSVRRKTGTAQNRTVDHALFICFAPARIRRSSSPCSPRAQATGGAAPALARVSGLLPPGRRQALPRGGALTCPAHFRDLDRPLLFSTARSPRAHRDRVRLQRPPCKASTTNTVSTSTTSLASDRPRRRRLGAAVPFRI